MSFFEDNKRTHDTEFTAEENEALLRVKCLSIDY
jgi:hypothetical protein